MNSQDILNFRLYNQHLVTQDFENCVDVVKHLGAVQAQDYYMTLWSFGLRVKNSTQETIDEQVNKKSIVRTWPLRGTIHYVLPENVRWMLKYFESRVKRKMQSYYTKEGLTDEIFLKSKKIIEKALSGGNALTREEIYEKLNQAKIETSNVRGLHILGQTASDGFICNGPRKAKHQTFVLLDEWVPEFPEIEKDEALQKLALLYFTSHGPAQIKDFAWWSGITITEAKLAVELNKDKLISEKVNENIYFMTQTKSKIKIIEKAYLLPPYDEYTVSYKDRSDMLPEGKGNILFSGSGFWSSMILNGRVLGMWRRTLSKDKVKIEFAPVRKLNNKEKDFFEKEAKEYSKFLNLEAEVAYKL